MKRKSTDILHYLDGVEAFVFDWDDTLVDTRTGKLAQNKAMAKMFGVERTDEEVSEYYDSGMPLMQMLAELCQTNDYDALEAARIKSYNNFEFTKRTIDGAERGVRIIRDLGFRTALFTATSEAALEMDMLTPGFRRELFDGVMHVPDMQKKSDPAAFALPLAWLAVRGIEAENAAYVGDGLGDMQGSLGAGMKFVGIEGGAVSGEMFAGHGVYSLPGVRQLAALARISGRPRRG